MNFPGNQNRDSIVWNDTRTKMFSIPCTLIFLYAWYEQYRSNIIFANLRKDKKSGEVVTEEHGIPRGRLFVYVSSPHRMCEVIMYTALVILLPTKTFACIYLWVLGNQVRFYLQRVKFYDFPSLRSWFNPVARQWNHLRAPYL